MDECLERALTLASKACRGLASVNVSWRPYECQWLAEANWADASRLLAAGDTPSEAVAALIERLSSLMKCTQQKGPQPLE